MNEKRRRKRTDKAGGQSLRSVQSRKGKDDLPEEVPQQKSQGNPEEDRQTAKPNIEVRLAMYSLKDRIRDWVLMRGPLASIGLAVVVSLVIVAIILAAAMPSKGLVNANAADVSDMKNTVAAVSNGLASKVSYQALNSSVQALDEKYAGAVAGLSHRVGTNEGNIGGLRTALTAVQDDIAGLDIPPPAPSLRGGFGNYTLYVAVADTGNFTANMHLVYSPAWGSAANQTAAVGNFYDGVTWGTTTPQYVPVATFNGTIWGISEVWWNIGKLSLVTGNVTILDITCQGLNSTWAPSFAYVEVWQVV